MYSKTNRLAIIIAAVSIGIIFVLQLHNSFSFPILRGLDAGSHLEYVNYLRENKRIPLPYEGWEMYQPPLYYLVLATLSLPSGVKILGFIMWLFLAFTSYTYYRRKFQSNIMALIGTFIATSLPVILYLTFAISNEFFSGVIIGFTLVYYSSFFSSTKLKDKFILGTLIGLSVLAKATAFVLIVAIALNQLVKSRYKIMNAVKELFVPFAVALLICGWFYVRNIVQFGNPFVASYDFPKIHPLEQAVIPRTPEFFLTLKGFYTLDIFNSHHYSFLSGTFFSWFYDGHNIIVPVQAFSKAGALLAVLSIPILVFFLVGFVKEYFEKKNKNIFFLLYCTLLFISYIAYNFRLPYYSTVKGVFLVSSSIPFGYFFLKGLMPYKKHFLFFTIYLVIYALVLAKNFWILPNWYPNI